jgi:Flp pilus assembly CpaE family ATPase
MGGYAGRSLVEIIIVALADSSEDSMRRLGLLRSASKRTTRAALLRNHSTDLVRDERFPGGVICSVFSTVPGAGVTTITAGLAVALETNSGKSIVVVDLDLQTDDLSMVLKVRGDATLADLCDGRKEFSMHALLRALRRHRSSVHVLAASRRIELNGSIQPSALASTLRALRQLLDFVSIDCGSRIKLLAKNAW